MAAARPQRPGHRGEMTTTAGERVLIVEDEPATRVGLTELVRTWGFTAVSASDGQEALDQGAPQPAVGFACGCRPHGLPPIARPGRASRGARLGAGGRAGASAGSAHRARKRA